MKTERPCPRCGGTLHPLTAQRQQAGRRAVILEWLICERCRYVALGFWQFVDPVGVRASDGGGAETDQEPS